MEQRKSLRIAFFAGFLGALITANMSCSSSKMDSDAAMPVDAPSTEGGSDAGIGGEPCASIAGHTFRSVSAMECGLGPDGGVISCNWTIMFNTDGSYYWRYSDIGQNGSYHCQGGVLFAPDQNGQVMSVPYDGTTHHLTWRDSDYVIVLP